MKAKGVSGIREKTATKSFDSNRRGFLKRVGILGAALAAWKAGNAFAAPFYINKLSQGVLGKKDKLLELLSGKVPQTYVPAGLFMHFDYSKFGGDMVKTHLAYCDYVDMDFVKVQYEYYFTQQNVPNTPADWKNVRRLPSGFLDKQLALVRGCVEGARTRGLPCIVTLNSALMSAGHGCGGDAKVAQHLLQDPVEVKKGLDIINEDVKMFAGDCVKLGVDGFLVCFQGGENNKAYPHETFIKYIIPLDLDRQSVIAECPVNILHVCDYLGQYDDLLPYKNFPSCKAINGNLLLKGNPISPTDFYDVFDGKMVFMGGLDKNGVINQAGKNQAIISLVNDLIAKGPERMMLGAQCTISNSQTAWDNVKLAINTAHTYYDIHPVKTRPVVRDPNDQLPSAIRPYYFSSSADGVVLNFRRTMQAAERIEIVSASGQSIVSGEPHRGCLSLGRGGHNDIVLLPGTYLMRLRCAGKLFSEKLVIHR